jgi:tRNA(Arg) A34 adenosine deaminase TadA
MDKRFMRLALKEARKNFKSFNGGPFGAVIVKNGVVLAVARNTVLKNDATCHAEINAIRLASRRMRTFDLTGAVIYSTTEPCPMCFTAIHWSRIGKIIYGTGIKDAAEIGFNEIKISNRVLKKMGKVSVRLVGGFLYDECRELLKDWGKLANKNLY